MSFPSFPLLGTFLLLSFVGTALACLAAAAWVQRACGEVEVPRKAAWKIAVAANAGGLLVGTMVLGVIAIPITLAVLAAELWFFCRAHDRLVTPIDRVLTKDGINAMFRGLPALIRSLRQGRGAKEAAPAAGAKGSAKAAKQSLGDRLKGIGQVLSKKKPASAAEAASAALAAVATPVKITLLKKDGQKAFEDQADEEMSGNVLAARKMLVDAMKLEATDIHFEPRGEQYHVRLRVDGVLQNSESMPLEAGKGVISALKVVSDMDISERRRPQDGTFSAVYNDDHYDMRSASTPTSYGEKMVIRILKSSGGILKGGLSNVGLRKEILEQLREVIHKPYGMFLVTGPTGSGKTTTVYASLSEIDSAQHNVTTIEDPVEYRLDGITQISVNTAAGVTFASILRSVLRQDPDVLLVGEIRDKETAEIACQAALTGHFVFSTLHANDTVATITRMLDLGLDATLIQTAVTAVLAQRLARRLCPKCKEAYPPPPDLLKKFGVQPGAIPNIYREKGCEACGGSGYKGRVGLHELMVLNDDIRKYIIPQPSIQDLRAAARRSKTRSLQTDGMLKVLQGITSVNEIVRVTTS